MPSLLVMLLALAALLCGCGGYDVTFNERLLYEAPKLLRDYEVDDPALSACLKQTIIDEEVTADDQLVRLSCTHAGIESLGGLERFGALEQLRLSNNLIHDASTLGGLTSLRVLLLDDNRLRDASALLSLPRLERVDLRGNPDLACPGAIARQPRGPGEGKAAPDLSLPEHCSDAAGALRLPPAQAAALASEGAATGNQPKPVS